MRVQFDANVLGYKAGDIVDLPADTEGLKDAIDGEYVTKVGRTTAVTRTARVDDEGAGEPEEEDDGGGEPPAE